MTAERRKSRTRSGAKITEPQRRSATFFLDEGLGNKVIPSALRSVGVRVEVLRDHFAGGVDDAEWLSEVGRRGWYVLTKDDRIRKRPVELRASIDSSVGAFILPSGNMSGPEMAQAIVNALPAIIKVIERRSPPFIYRISRSGTIWPL